MRKERSKIKRINVEYKAFYYKEVKGKQFNIIAILVSGYILNDFKQCSRANAKSMAAIKPEKCKEKIQKEEKENRAHTKRDTQKIANLLLPWNKFLYSEFRSLFELVMNTKYAVLLNTTYICRKIKRLSCGWRGIALSCSINNNKKLLLTTFTVGAKCEKSLSMASTKKVKSDWARNIALFMSRDGQQWRVI